MKVSIIGIGFVGNAIYTSLIKNGFILNDNLFIYDKFKNGGIGTLESCIDTDIMFIALPTLYNNELKHYDTGSIKETCELLNKLHYNGTVIIKSTIEPETTSQLSNEYPNLHFIHNPEFLTARTACEDFHNQAHIVIGKSSNLPEDKLNCVISFYSKYYPNAEISICSATESESMKIFCNSFYSIKVQFFTELYLLCSKNGTSYDTIKNLMLKNNWINPMHTIIPGPDGQVSYGGACFPKDTNALNQYMKQYNTPNMVLESTIIERNNIRNDL
jgi:UDPglucose 6-dehydrogenase